jgi:1,4-dihydroxy-2-naphthoyl-CoA hydrolase
MSFVYQRTIHFADTDAAGLVFFANYLALCHEAYEEALETAGIKLGSFFSDTAALVPVTRSEAQYLRPLHCGDKVKVFLRPERLNENSYAIHFEVVRLGQVDKLSAKIRTEHVCISSKNKERLPLPQGLAAWVDSGNA